jgi:hypothetical protein
MFNQFRANELMVDDKVEIFNGPFGTGIVYAVLDKEVLICRPFAMVHSGIPLLGSEKMSFLLSDRRTFNVYRESRYVPLGER